MSNLELQLLCNLGADDKTETTNCFHLSLFTEFSIIIWYEFSDFWKYIGYVKIDAELICMMNNPNPLSKYT